MTEMYDVIIIGGGIASATAGIYTARASMKPLIISGKDLDQLSLTTSVENYPGFPEGVQGPDLTKNCRKQAEKFGATYIEENVEKVTKAKNHIVVTAAKKEYKTRTLIICTGASARTTGIPGEQKYFGRGVSTCAVCDAALYRNRTAVVIGGGDSAMEEALALYKFANKVYIVHRRDQFRASKIMQDRVLKLTDKIEVVWNAIPTEVIGDDKFVKSVKIKDTKTGKEKEIKCDGMFLAIGHIPNTKLFKGLIDLDNHGYITTEHAKTSVKNIYAAGDVQDPFFRQAITSAGTGCEAAIQAEKFIENLKATGKY